MRIMDPDPHPLVGWAKFLRWQPLEASVNERRNRLLNEAVAWAEKVYRHWRPELRYKVVDVPLPCVNEVQQAAKWFVDNQSRF